MALVDVFVPQKIYKNGMKKPVKGYIKIYYYIW